MVQKSIRTNNEQSMKKLGIVVPYRDREEHLKEFIPHMKNFLEVAQIPHKIIVVEQADEKSFNRAKLMNIGYDVLKDQCDYFCFHDVDLLPEEGADYTWVDNPTHLSQYCSQFNYVMPSYNNDKIFGGVTMFNKADFNRVNGFSNIMWGWGGEDDEIRSRCDREQLKVDRRPGRYTSLPHPRAMVNRDEYRQNFNEWVQIRDNKDSKDYQTNGINSLEYKVAQIKHGQDYSLIKVML